MMFLTHINENIDEEVSVSITDHLEIDQEKPKLVWINFFFNYI